VEKYKARLVPKGYAQHYGVDYTKVFTLVARLDTIRVILAVQHNMDEKFFSLMLRVPSFTVISRRKFLCTEFKKSMMMEFYMSNMGRMKHFLGV